MLALLSDRSELARAVNKWLTLRLGQSMRSLLSLEMRKLIWWRRCSKSRCRALLPAGAWSCTASTCSRSLPDKVLPQRTHPIMTADAMLCEGFILSATKIIDEDEANGAGQAEADAEPSRKRRRRS